MIADSIKAEVKARGFAEIAVEDGSVTGAAYSAGCSGNRSDCCTRVCSEKKKCLTDETSAGASEAWEEFLFLEGGEIQY